MLHPIHLPITHVRAGNVRVSTPAVTILRRPDTRYTPSPCPRSLHRSADNTTTTTTPTRRVRTWCAKEKMHHVQDKNPHVWHVNINIYAKRKISLYGYRSRVHGGPATNRQQQPACSTKLFKTSNRQRLPSRSIQLPPKDQSTRTIPEHPKLRSGYEHYPGKKRRSQRVTSPKHHPMARGGRGNSS